MFNTLAITSAIGPNWENAHWHLNHKRPVEARQSFELARFKLIGMMSVLLYEGSDEAYEEVKLLRDIAGQHIKDLL